MLHVNLTIVHEIKGRMRLYLEQGLVNTTTALRYIQKGGIYNCSYNKKLKTLVVCYNNQTREEVLARVSVIYASQHKLQYAHIINESQSYSKISPSGKLALISITLNMGLQFFCPGQLISTVANWCAVGTTIGTILEHGYQEITQRGTFDPEVMSVVYLLSAVSKGQALYATPGAWLLTFGRHLLADNSKEMMVKVVARKRKGAYNVSVLKHMNSNKKTSILKETINQVISGDALTA